MTKRFVIFVELLCLCYDDGGVRIMIEYTIGTGHGNAMAFKVLLDD